MFIVGSLISFCPDKVWLWTKMRIYFLQIFEKQKKRAHTVKKLLNIICKEIQSKMAQKTLVYKCTVKKHGLIGEQKFDLTKNRQITKKTKNKTWLYSCLCVLANSTVSTAVGKTDHD